jgi:hypothetical protein
MNNRKAQHNEWAKELKVYLMRIIWCERCKKRRATDIAHRLKRRLIGWRTELDRAEYFMAAKLCRPCHRDLDEHVGDGGHERMFLIVTRLAETRPRGTVYGKYQALHPTRLWDPETVYSYGR